MEIGRVNMGVPSTEQMGTVRANVQVEMLKKAMDSQAQQAAQLVQSVQPAPQPGQPGAIVNTFA